MRAGHWAPLVFLIAVAAFAPPLIRLVTITGTVRSSDGQPVPYAMVTVSPLGANRFADQSGRFAFLSVPRGRYRLLVRQVGYQPLDTAIAVDTLNLDLALVLTPLTLRLDSIVVAAAGPCRSPGPPDSLTHSRAYQLRSSSAPAPSGFSCWPTRSPSTTTMSAPSRILPTRAT